MFGQGINPMSSRPTGVGMSLAGRAAVMDLGLGSQLAEQAEETEEQRRQRLMRLMGQDTSSLLSLGNPYGV
jgi:hypothetical protein